MRYSKQKLVRSNLVAYLRSTLSPYYFRCFIARRATFVLFAFKYRSLRFALYTSILRISSKGLSHGFSHLKTSGSKVSLPMSWFWHLSFSFDFVKLLVEVVLFDCSDKSSSLSVTDFLFVFRCFFFFFFFEGDLPGEWETISVMKTNGFQWTQGLN